MGRADGPSEAGADHALLRGSGLRVTPARLAVLTALANHPHSTADEVHRLAASRTTVSLQAVYLILQAMSDRGLLRRIEPAGSAVRYERRVDDNHHHLVCERCAAVTDVDCVAGEAPCLAPSDASGYAVTRAEITFWGVCADCLSAAAAPGASTSVVRPGDGPLENEGAS